ncbi:VOC family protein [Aquipuribacter sp. SD81]|uniref:VOC family protein n=1 Tax=Aquipuribacter sp. SD81 TaxID=3127703 RepID=UPI0030198D21
MDTSSPGTTGAAPPRARVDSVGIVSGDLAATAAFYRALGGDVPDPDESGHLAWDAGGTTLMADTEAVMRSFSTDTWSGPGAGRLTLAARCASPADVDALHEALVPLGRGSHVAPFDASWGMRYATVLDPDGNRVDLYADLPQQEG